MFCDVVGGMYIKTLIGLLWTDVLVSHLYYYKLTAIVMGHCFSVIFFFLEKEISIYLFICFWLGWVFTAGPFKGSSSPWLFLLQSTGSGARGLQ